MRQRLIRSLIAALPPGPLSFGVFTANFDNGAFTLSGEGWPTMRLRRRDDLPGK